MLNAFGVQDVGKPHRFMPGIIPLPGAENDAHVVEFPRIIDVRQVVVGTVEINIVVVIAIEKRTDIERAAERDEVADGVRMAKRDIGRVLGPEARAAHRHARRRTFPPRQIEDEIGRAHV